MCPCREAVGIDYIADNGIGIEEQYGTQIFGMFKRLHRDQYPGVGAGLAICKRIVTTAAESRASRNRAKEALSTPNGRF